VNNAGIMAHRTDQASSRWRNGIGRLMSILRGFSTGLPLPCLKCRSRKSGHIINVASVFGIKVFAPGGTVYSATKSAVRALTEGLRVELHSENIRCTMISPGAVATEIPESSSEEATRENLREFYKMAIPANSSRERDRLRHRATARGGNRRGRHPARASKRSVGASFGPASR